MAELGDREQGASEPSVREPIVREQNVPEPSMRELSIVKQITRIESAAQLDPVVEKVDGVVSRVISAQWLRDLLHGVPFGHPVHPVAVQVPIGAMTSVAILDLAPGTSSAATVLTGIGVASAVPAMAAGWTDWMMLHPEQKRVGLVHAVGNAAGIALYALSFVQRVRGRQRSAKMLAYAGFGLLAGAGFLGGHLAYRQASGANHTEDVPHLFPQGWQRLAELDELSDGTLDSRTVAGQPLLVYRRGDSVRVFSDKCSHLSGPLHEGEVTDGCVVCPWHGSTFDLETGDVVHGPATAPQPRFDTRVTNGSVEVRLQNAG
jgi:nitrite reductase/ring-hydroxylating ferredoxin subunit/uncharacterized membrane protein